MNNRHLFLILKRTVNQHKFLSAGLFLMLLVSILSALLPPLVLEVIVNRLALQQPLVPSLAVLYFAALIITGLSDAAREALITVFGQKITRGLRHEMCQKLTRLPAAYFTAEQPGVTVSRFVNDVDTVEALFTSGVISMFTDMCKVVSILIVIFVKSRGLGILMVIATPVLFIITRLFQKKMLKSQTANRAAVGRVTGHVPETIHNIRMLHNFSKEPYMEKRYDQYIEDSYHAMETANFCDAIYSPIIHIISACIIAVMMLCAASGGAMMSLFGMSVGTAVAVIAYVSRVFDPLESIGMEIQSIQSAVAGVKRIREFMDTPEKPQTDENISCEQLLEPYAAAAAGLPAFMNCSVPKVIVLDHVDFSYDGEHRILENKTFAIQAGERVTLTGRTGAGKSTVFNLLLGLYTPDAGHVYICGCDAGKIPDAQKRRLFGDVPQSFVMIPGTLREQITLFDPCITDEMVFEAARKVGLHEIILSMPQGYDTLCRTFLLSQGQWQLLSIARAIAADPAILLLDEITANLDSETEKKVLEALEYASRNRTVLSISHRLYEQSGGRIIQI